MLEIIAYLVVAMLGMLGFKFMTLPRNSWVGVLMVFISLVAVWVVTAIEASVIGFMSWNLLLIVAALSTKRPNMVAL